MHNTHPHNPRQPRARSAGVPVLATILTLAAVLALALLATVRVEAGPPATAAQGEARQMNAPAGITPTLYLPLAMRARPTIQGHGILFISDRAEAGKYDIYRMDADGGNVQRLTHFAIDSSFYESRPRWSPDGTRIAVQVEGALYLLQPDGSDIWPLVDDPMLKIRGRPAWSPDGSKIAYIVYRCIDPRPNCFAYTETGSGLQVIDVHTKQVTILDDNSFLSQYAGVHWTPDGLSLLSVPDDDPGIYVNRLDDLSQTKIFNGRDVTELDVAPNGQKLAFVDNPVAYTANIDGSNEQTLYSGYGDGATVWHSIWHPNGQRVAYMVATNNGDDQTIYAAAPDGSNRFEITPFDRNSRKHVLGWTPDGSHFLYMSDRDRDYQHFDVYVVNADGSNPVNLTPDSPADDVASDYYP